MMICQNLKNLSADNGGFATYLGKQIIWDDPQKQKGQSKPVPNPFQIHYLELVLRLLYGYKVKIAVNCIF
jgi:hypothetical protein